MSMAVIEHKKGDPYYLAIPAVTASDRKALSTGETVSEAIYYKDGNGSWTSHSISDSFSEVGSVGIYEIDLTGAEMDHDQILMKMTSTNMEVYTVLFNCRSALAEDLSATTAGGSLNYEATGDNTGGAIEGVSFVGTATSGSYSSTEAEDGTYHQIDDSSNEIDIIYSFNVGGGKTASEVTWMGYLNGGNDTMNIQAYDFGGSTWDTRSVIIGQSGSNNITLNVPLLSKHTGTGSDIGKVYIRIQNSGQTNPTLYTDEILVNAVITSQTAGYVDGAIWVKSTGTSGTEAFVNGTADNPCPWADAVSLNSTLGLNKFRIANGDTVTLAASADGYTMSGFNWNLALASQSCVGIYVEGANVSGIATGTGTAQTFERCSMGATTHIAGTVLGRCAIAGTQTIGEAGDYFWDHCFSAIAGTATPVFDYGAVGSTNWSNRHYSGGIQIENMGDSGTDTASIEGYGQLVEGTCTSGTVAIRGSFTVSSITNITLSDDARLDSNQVRDAVVDDATRLDASALNTATVTSIPAIKSQTDKLGFTSSNSVNANIEEINDYTIQGTGESSNKWRPV